MKRQWLALAARIDALSERERLLAFAAAVALLVFLGHAALLGPALHRQDLLRAELQQQQEELATIDQQVGAKLREAGVDPDAPQRARLGEVRSEFERMQDRLRAMQKGLVAPERVVPLLESMLRANGRLTMVSVRTLPVEPLSALGGKRGEPAPQADAAPRRELLFRHGVELTVRGSYPDLVDYMRALETLPAQLFWGKARLDVEAYPSVRLTLTLYTLSLEEKWIKL